jgi:hypothetical protein
MELDETIRKDIGHRQIHEVISMVWFCGHGRVVASWDVLAVL